MQLSGGQVWPKWWRNRPFGALRRHGPPLFCAGGTWPVKRPQLNALGRTGPTDDVLPQQEEAVEDMCRCPDRSEIQ